MELRAYFFIIRKWLWLVVLCTVLAAVSAFLFSGQQTPVYQASSKLLLDNSKPTTDTASFEQIMANGRLMSTYAQLLNGREAFDKVIEELGYEPQILEIFVTAQRDTVLLDVRVESNVPQAAAFVANRLPEIVDEQQRVRQAARYNQAASTFNEQLDSAANEIAQLREQVAELEEKNADQSEIERLNGNLSLQVKTYETLLGDLSVIKLAEVENSNLLSLIEKSYEEEVAKAAPIRPRTLLNTLLAAIVGAMVGLGAGFLVEYLDDTIKPTTDLRQIFGLGTLAFIGRNEQADEDERFLLSKQDNRTQFAEAYRMLRTNIRFASVDNPLRTLVVTSARPSEGKSTTAANLAVVMAQQGLSTILVDADLRKPVQHKIFQKGKGATGLTSALINRKEGVGQYLQPTEVENLRILPSGPIPPNPSELLGSQRMRDVLSELEKLADLVVIDSAPVLSVADTSLLASAVSGVLLVVRANSTNFESFGSAVEQLEGAKAHVIGTVMNDVVREGSGYYYYYNSYYSSDDSDDSSGPSKGLRNRPTGVVGRLQALFSLVTRVK
ncbi:MAG: polysaccharide biosynthesis tyrosine autokinase [Ardenticatenaceae bacterium]